MELLIWILIAYGMSNILVWGSIFRVPRQSLYDMSLVPGLHQPVAKFFADLVQCMMCTSTWVGFFLGAVVTSPTYWLFGTTPYISWFFDGLMASGAVWAINSVIEWFEQNRPTNNNN